MTDRVPASWDEALEALLRGEAGQVVLTSPVPIDGGEPGAENDNQRHSRTRQGYPMGQVRGVLAERVVVSTELDPFLPLKALADYSGLSVRNLRECLDDPAHPLPHYRVGGKILVRRSEFDAWIARYRQVGQVDVDRVVSEAVRDLC